MCLRMLRTGNRTKRARFMLFPVLNAALLVVVVALSGCAGMPGEGLVRPACDYRCMLGNFDKVQPGMNKTQVRSALGRPSGTTPAGGGRGEYWAWDLGKSTVGYVEFDSTGNVARVIRPTRVVR